MKAVGGEQHQAQAQHQSAPPNAPGPGRARVRAVRPILAAIDRARPGDQTKQHQEQRAQCVQPQMRGFASDCKRALKFPRHSVSQSNDRRSRPACRARENASQP